MYGGVANGDAIWGELFLNTKQEEYKISDIS